MITTFDISTDAGTQIRVCRLEASPGLSRLPRELGLSKAMPAVVLVGGANSLDDAARERLKPLFLHGLAIAVENTGAVILDGGTNAGVMRLAGESRKDLNARFALVGVAAVGTIELPGAKPPATDAAPAEPNHSHLVLVPGDHFGDESPWIADIAREIAGERSSVTILIGGGAISWEDVENSVAMGRPVIILEGSGGTADALAKGLEDSHHTGRIARLAATGQFHIVHASDGPDALRVAIEEALSEPPSIAPASSHGRRDEQGKGGDDAVIVEMIGALSLTEAKRRFLDGRWLDQIQWMERKAAVCQRHYYWSRRVIIVGSALVPVLTTASIAAKEDEVISLLRWASIFVSLLVTIAAAWEEFFRNGDRWRHYRQTIEQLRREGWLFFERSGPYAEYPSHARAHAAFVLRVEQILAEDVQRFIGQIAVEKRPGRGQASASADEEEAKGGGEAQ